MSESAGKYLIYWRKKNNSQKSVFWVGPLDWEYAISTIPIPIQYQYSNTISHVSWLMSQNLQGWQFSIYCESYLKYCQYRFQIEYCCLFPKQTILLIFLKLPSKHLEIVAGKIWFWVFVFLTIASGVDNKSPIKPVILFFATCTSLVWSLISSFSSESMLSSFSSSALSLFSFCLQ